MTKITIEQIEYHRNGVMGEGFWIVKFKDISTRAPMLAIVFLLEEGQTWNGRVAVFNQELLSKGEIRFGWNSYRGHHYETVLRQAIYEHERNQ